MLDKHSLFLFPLVPHTSLPSHILLLCVLPFYLKISSQKIKQIKKNVKLILLFCLCFCYDCFFSSLAFSFKSSSTPLYLLELLSTDQFSHTDYLVPFTHHFHHVLSCSTMTRPLVRAGITWSVCTLLYTPLDIPRSLPPCLRIPFSLHHTIELTLL